MAQQADTDDTDTIRNERRGCGYLKPKSAYLRSGVPSKDGVLPAFVEFDDYIPYLERSKFRSYEVFPGVQFELSVTGNAADPTLPSPLSPDVPTEDGFVQTDPPGEIHNHLRRLAGSGRGTHAGEFAAFHTHDLYMHVGASYYEDPEEFIAEVKTQGLSKKIPVSESQEPPVINPGLTRLFLVHPKALDEDDDGENEQAAVIGYVYLTRIVYTEDKAGRYPGWAQKMANAGLLDLVERGPQIDEDGTVAETLDDLDDPESVPTEEGDVEHLDDYLPAGVLGVADDPEPYDANEPTSEDPDTDEDAPDPEVLSAIVDKADEEGITFEEAEVLLEDENGEIHLDTDTEEDEGAEFVCEHCGDGFDTDHGRRGHMRWCDKKPDAEDA